MKKKNTMLLTIIAVATLLVVVVGATFAYFTTQNGASGSTTATVTTETIGAITVSNEDPALYLDLTAAQMQEGATGSYWATKVKGEEPGSTIVDADKAVIAKLNVSGGGEETIYSCNFKITVDKTDVTLAYGDATVVFALENNAEILGVTSGREIDYTTLLNEYTVNFTRIGHTEEDLPLVSVAMKVNNTETEQGFAGETLTTRFTSTALDCEVVDDSKVLSGTWRFNDDLTLPNETMTQNVNYSTISTVPQVDAEFNIQCNGFYLNEDAMLYNSVSSTPNMEDYGDFSFPSSIYMYVAEGVLSEFSGWNNYAFDERIKTITFTKVQIVSAEFYSWFTANAKRIVEVQELPTQNINTNVIYKTYDYVATDNTAVTTLSGTWKFNDEISMPFDSYSKEIVDFTVDFIVPEYDLAFEWKCVEFWYGVGLVYGIESTSPDMTEYGLSTPISLIVYASDDANIEFVGWNYLYFNESIRVVTFTEEQTFSTQFYEWFINNAKVQFEKYYLYVDGEWIEQ